MTDIEIMRSRRAQRHLGWEIEDRVRYGAPSNERDKLVFHPEHLFYKITLRFFDENGKERAT